MTRLRYPDSSVPTSRRSLRRRRVAELRAQGRYGPELREVLPSFVGLGLVLLTLLLLAGRLSHAFGATGLLMCALLSVTVAPAALRLRRRALRRRRGRYTAQELARLDDRGLVEATTRMLERDGWRVADLSLRKGDLHLYARDRHGRALDVRFRPAVTADEDARWLKAPRWTMNRPGPRGSHQPP
ncbi:hypothetical protein [Streptomyces sp. NPDC046870]|uniref:hypothetical protein n=1 Tax=Streptomyces sp. NPDC046870 TaxID=3155135 RepID=UPI0034516B76